MCSNLNVYRVNSLWASAAFGLRTSNLVYGCSTMSRITPTCEMTSNLEAPDGMYRKKRSWTRQSKEFTDDLLSHPHNDVSATA